MLNSFNKMNSEVPFSLDAELLYECSTDGKKNAVEILDEFLSNVGRLAAFVEPCKLKVSPKNVIEISSAVPKGSKTLLQWNDIKQVHALTPSHLRYNNVVSIWSSRKIYLVHLKSQQASTFAAYVNATQFPSCSLYDVQKSTEIAMLNKCFEELSRFVDHEETYITKQVAELKRIDEETLELTGQKKVKGFRKCIAKYCCCCCGCKVPDLERNILARGSIVTLLLAKKPVIVEALQTVRHGYLIFTRIAPTLQRIGYCKSQVEFACKLTMQFASVVKCAKIIAMLPMEPNAEGPSSAKMDQLFSIISSVSSPPLTDVAIKTIETYLPEQPQLAADWPKFGANWSLSIHEQDLDSNDWGMASQQHLKELNRDVELLRSSLRRSLSQLIERRIIAEVELSKRMLQDRLQQVEQQKQILVDGNETEKLLDSNDIFYTPPRRSTLSVQQSFLAEIKKRNGRALIVLQANESGTFKVFDKEKLEILQDLGDGHSYRVRNADGVIGSLPANAGLEIKL